MAFSFESMSRQSMLCLALLGASCSTPTQLIVQVDTDYAVPTQLDTVRFEVTGPSGTTRETIRSLGAAEDPSFPLTLTVVPSNDALGPVQIVAIGQLASGEVVRQSAVVTLARNRSTTLRLFLGRGCAGIDCADEQTCRCGTCMGHGVSSLGDWSGMPEGGDPCGGGDAGTRDGGVDGGSDAGMARCDGDFDCDDGVECTNDRCIDGSCERTPDAALCVAGPEGRCDTETGCQYPSCSSETCIAGPCQTASCLDDVCVRESACEADESCCAGACVAAGCDDGIGCTADSCGAEGCLHQPMDALCDDGDICTDDACDASTGCGTASNSAACDDGVFCNGSDTCSDGSCSTHAGNPCPAGSSMCVEGSSTCVCATAAECPDDLAGPPSACDFGDDICTTTGTQTRTITSYECTGGVCVGTDSTETSSCTRPSTNGTACGSTTFGPPGACDWDGACDQIATRLRDRFDLQCNGGMCQTLTTSVSEGCSRTTNGDSCSDSAFCNGTDTCSGGTCSSHSGNPCGGGIVCNEGSDTCECGTYGDVCCAGNSCDEGSCLSNRCVTFGGAYGFDGEPGDQVCRPNPLTGACTCPSGFLDEYVGDLDGDTDEGSGWETRIYHCRSANDAPGADYRGAFDEQLSAPPGTCASACTGSNPVTSSCACPVGSTVDAIEGVHYQSGTSNDCRQRIGICRGSTPLTYGGWYRQMVDTGIACQEIPIAQRCQPNPVTGVCNCPGGFSPVTMDAMMLHTVPARAASNWHCDALLTICVGSP